MKNLGLILIVFISFLSCNKDKKSKYISVEKEANSQTIEEAIASSLDTMAYAERGVKYAMNTQAVLGKNLMQAIQETGTSGALSFCNEKAYPLTDSC